MSGKPKGSWGGKRENQTGRPRKRNISDVVKANYLKAARKLAKEFGMPIEEAVMRLAYDPDTQDTVKVAVIKAYNEALLVKETEQKVEITKNQGLVIGLPEMEEDPALKVIQGGK